MLVPFLFHLNAPLLSAAPPNALTASQEPAELQAKSLLVELKKGLPPKKIKREGAFMSSTEPEQHAQNNTIGKQCSRHESQQLCELIKPSGPPGSERDTMQYGTERCYKLYRCST